MVRIHGNWCGPGWTAGRAIGALEYKQQGGTFNEPCVDELDCACRNHDRDCANPLGCSRKGDSELIKTALKISLNPYNRLFRTDYANKAGLIAAGITAARAGRKR